MRTRVLGGIVVVWGGGVLVSGLFQGYPGVGPYGAGQIAGLVFGGVLLLVGLYYLLKGSGIRRA